MVGILNQKQVNYVSHNSIIVQVMDNINEDWKTHQTLRLIQGIVKPVCPTKLDTCLVYDCTVSFSDIQNLNFHTPPRNISNFLQQLFFHYYVINSYVPYKLLVNTHEFQAKVNLFSVSCFNVTFFHSNRLISFLPPQTF